MKERVDFFVDEQGDLAVPGHVLLAMTWIDAVLRILAEVCLDHHGDKLKRQWHKQMCGQAKRWDALSLKLRSGLSQNGYGSTAISSRWGHHRESSTALSHT
mmetsp:Transcript_8763/g.15073  ORF Transcript_8763/g.15073 Transcript_8763/m.15073 type:complete len:101 (-) Transcript_8763:91-393(-)